MASTAYTDEELEALHLAAMIAMNGFIANNTGTLYPERIANDSYNVAEAMIKKAREYDPS